MKEKYIFSDKIQQSVIIHIPHSGTEFPSSNCNKSLLYKDIQLSTDWFTDAIFKTDLTTVKAPLSKLYVDVERFVPDEMDKFGRGFYYTKDSFFNTFRDESDKEDAFARFCTYHEYFNRLVDEKFDEVGFCTIIDCHSFNEEKLPFESFSDRPEICIGTDSFHTPKWLEDEVVSFFKEQGFKVLVNSPYSGSFVSQKHYKKDKNVFSIMIEINKKLYIHDTTKIKYLNEVFTHFLESLN